MRLLKTILFAAITTLSTQAMAVDGYKDLKFGMSLKQVKKSYPCKWTAYTHVKNSWHCPKILFMGENTTMLTTFDDGKLARVAINVPISLSERLINALKEKYTISTYYDENDTFSEVKFDDDTVTLQMKKGNASNDYDYKLYLMYSIKDFDKKESKKTRENDKKDL
ncbi:hypothetical protein ACUHGC_05325 [Testudinibacter sp. P27/CKL/0425]